MRNEKSEVGVQFFSNCNFHGDLTLSKVIFSKPIFDNADDVQSTIKLLDISGCEFINQARFILNKCNVGIFKLANTSVKSKFEFKEGAINEFIVDNTNFDELLDAYKTKFIKFRIYKSIFSDFVGFERCQFGEVDQHDRDFVSRYIYATFTNFINFRNAKFHSGLDISRVNWKEPPNFLYAYVNPINTSRETFRIIKFSFDRLGNQIEANKYYSLEMRKYEEELKKANGHWQERVVLKLNKWISNFGQNYVTPIVLIIVLAVIFHYIESGYEHGTLYTMVPIANHLTPYINWLNNVAKGLLPISKYLPKGLEFTGMLFYFAYAGLTWQAIVAIKRHTKR